MTTEREALDRIAALCDEAQPDPMWDGTAGLAPKVRAVLAEVTPEPGYEQGYRDGGNNVLVDWRIAWEEHGPEGEVPSFSEAAKRLTQVPPEPGGVLDRDALRNCIDHALHPGQGDGEPSVDAVVGWIEVEAVRPAAIDRDALEAIWPWHWNQEERDTFTNKVLALVRPAGVTLTPEEATLVVSTLHTHAIEYPGYKEDRMEALARRLAARLEAGS